MPSMNINMQCMNSNIRCMNCNMLYLCVLPLLCGDLDEEIFQTRNLVTHLAQHPPLARHKAKDLFPNIGSSIRFNAQS